MSRELDESSADSQDDDDVGELAKTPDWVSYKCSRCRKPLTVEEIRESYRSPCCRALIDPGMSDKTRALLAQLNQRKAASA